MSPSHFQDYELTAESDQEAERRFRIAKSLDPFPQIQPSLLNSADIHDYIRMTGMLYPYDPDDLKSASYEAPIYWKCIVWDEKGERRDLNLEEGKDEEFILKANSIALVQAKPHFRLPDYIALRFNLKIKNVHRGILLGTGPLVDPGFEGKLVIPLHNLTTNDYVFKRDEGLIWIEFTKTTVFSEVASSGSTLSRRGVYRPFRDDKKNHDPDWYIDKATQHRSIRSSIPDTLRQGLEAAREAEAGAKKVEQYVKFLSVGGGIVLLLTLGTLAFQTWSLIGDAWKAVSDVQQFIQSARQDDRNSKLEELKKQLELMDERVTGKISTLQEQVDKVKVDVNRARTGPPTVKQ